MNAAGSLNGDNVRNGKKVAASLGVIIFGFLLHVVVRDLTI